MEGEGEGEGYLYLCLCDHIVGIDMKKILSGGFQTNPPDLTALSVDNVTIFKEEKLPFGMGFCVDGSKLYMAGGEWPPKRRRRHGLLELDNSKGYKGISSSMYVANLFDSDPIGKINFSKLHEFEAPKTSTVMMNINQKIYALSTNFTYFSGFKMYAIPFEVYDPDSHSSKSVTRRLRAPPFYERYERGKRDIRGYALVGNTLCVQVGDFDCHFYYVNSGIWRPSPRQNSRFLSSIITNGLGRNLCHGKFVLGCENVLISILCTRMEAFLLPPPGSNENAPVLCQMFNEVDDDLSKIDEFSYEIDGGLVLNLDKEKMCAIFSCGGNPEHNFLVYIYIFQVSKLPEQPRTKRIKRLQTDFRPILKDFLPVTCLHKGFYYLNKPGFDFPLITGAFYL